MSLARAQEPRPLMTVNQPPFPEPMAAVVVRLGDLGLAPENLRFKEPADDGIPQLADTMAAAGVLLPPIVRTGRDGEQPFMALDGRRRRFGLCCGASAARSTDDFPVTCKLAVTRRSRRPHHPAQRRGAPAHIADVITAIGKFRKAKMATDTIATALGYSELDIKRLEALSGVHPKVLKALREGRLTLKQVRLFARLRTRSSRRRSPRPPWTATSRTTT